MDFVFANKSLSAAQVRELENQLIANPNDLECRARLASFYLWQGMRAANTLLELIYSFGRKQKEPTFRSKFREHVLWIVEHCPLSAMSGDPMIRTLALTDAEGCRLGSEIWLRHVESNPANAMILSRASSFLWHSDRQRSLELKCKACDLEPTNPSYSRDLAQVYSIMAEKAPSEDLRKKAWKLALIQKEKEYANCLPRMKSKILKELKELSTNAGDNERAQRYSEEMVGQEPID